MYINSKNKTNEIITITTNDAKFYYDEKQIESPYKTNIPLIKLQPNQEISLSAITNIATEHINTIYSAVSVVYYKQNSDNDFNFILESRGQITEKRILNVAIINIKLKMKKILKLISDNPIDNNNIEGKLIINGEDHTMGNLITRGLQLHQDIDFAGYSLPHPLSNIIHIIEDVVEYYNNLFDKIDNLIK